MKFFGLVFAVFALVAVFEVSASRKGNCELDCPLEVNFKTVWTLDGSTCRPLQNRCLMKRENCLRLGTNLKPLRLTTERTCKTYCTTMCKFSMGAVCGVLNGHFRLFTSLCAMENDICLSGLPYTPTHLELCGVTATETKLEHSYDEYPLISFSITQEES